MKKSELKRRLAECRQANRQLADINALYEHRVGLIADMLSSIFDGPDEPSVETVILSCPATVVLWDDGTKTVAKLRDGDEWDPLFVILACIVRKLTHNRGHAVSESYDLIRAIAGDIESPEDLDDLIDYGRFVLDVLDVLRDAAPLWTMMLGDAVDDTDADEPDVPDEAERERTRGEIRDLVDRGEL